LTFFNLWKKMKILMNMMNMPIKTLSLLNFIRKIF
jgi:ABC-type histidine transport system ATPase subunit